MRSSDGTDLVEMPTSLSTATLQLLLIARAAISLFITHLCLSQCKTQKASSWRCMDQSVEQVVAEDPKTRVFSDAPDGTTNGRRRTTTSP